jgi:hypothetical protein
VHSTRVVPYGKRKVMIIANHFSPKFFTRLKVTERNNSDDFLKLKKQVSYFFKVSARKLTVLFHASAASFGR